MAPTLPASLSPHICILPSPDLVQLLEQSSLPPLPYILQSFSPFPQVTTRTTSLASVSHPSFTLRFSDLSEIETACREDEEQRAVRTIDWIGARISHRCTKWVEDMEKRGDSDLLRTPWWDELKRCAEGDHVPSRIETWNHPVAVILAVSTNASNPLQAITALHSRPIGFPTWVDPAFLRYTLIIHPQNSVLSDEEAGALFNAVKKQFGLHTYLLPLSMPNPPPKPVAVPAVIPRLPPPPTSDSPELRPAQLPTSTPSSPNLGPAGSPNFVLNTLRMNDKDIQQTARFTREFLVMSLIPWMERCVVEWNETFSSSRRLPSRLFSSTRRLFGSPSPSPAPTHNPGPASGLGRANSINGGLPSSSAPPPQQRRLAEFSTILGDLKLAVTVWEALRKEGKGGSEILPLLLSPTPALQLHVSNALASIHPPTSELPPHAQLRALSYAVRWEVGIGHPGFLDSALDGERWLVWAAGNSEEAPSALLLAHAALLSAKKKVRRRAALLYLSAANRLEKCGIKPLTMYFLRRAHDMYKFRPQKELSPSFWDSEGLSPDALPFDAVMAGIEHPLGRLLYTTGDVEAAIRFFLGLLRVSAPFWSILPAPNVNGNGNIDGEAAAQPSPEKVFLDDFRVAFTHFKSISNGKAEPEDLQLPFTLCLPRQTRLRLPRDVSHGDASVWQKREEDWSAFWKSQGGKESLSKSGKAAVDESFWVDLVLCNPLDVEVNLSNLTVAVEESEPDGSSSSKGGIEVEVAEEVILGPRESRTIPISVTASRPTSLTITHATFDFLALLPCTESLSRRGRRLQDTAAHRQTATYAADVPIKVEIVEASYKLSVNFVDDQRLVLGQGEIARLGLWFTNTGTKPISEVWMVAGTDDEVWVEDTEGDPEEEPSSDDVLPSRNSIAPRKPYRISLSNSESPSVLEPGLSKEISLLLHTEQTGERDLSLVFVYREDDLATFHPVRVIRYYEVQPILKIALGSRPLSTPDDLFLLNVNIDNVTPSTTIQITGVTTLSPTWKCHSIGQQNIGPVSPLQSCRLALGASQWQDASGSQEVVDFVSKKIKSVLYGVTVEPSQPPPINLCCSRISKTHRNRLVSEAATRHFIHSGRRNLVTHSIVDTHPHIPAWTHSSIFPLYHPNSVDVVVFWEDPSQRRSGHILVSGVTMGAGHAALRDVISEAESAKVTRSMYAETRREKAEIIQAIVASEWNLEMDPLTVTPELAVSLKHDFANGPCRAPISFVLRNHSLTHRCRFVLNLRSAEALPAHPSNSLTPSYQGRLTFRGILEPSQLTSVRSTVWITRPGTYNLGRWRVESEVLELNSVPDGDDVRIRHRYVQEPPLRGIPSISVSNVLVA